MQAHVSTALKHERHWVTWAGLVVAACAAVQMLIFGFVHFTEVRWTSVRRSVPGWSYSVVESPPAAKVEGRGPRPAVRVADLVAADANRVLSHWDHVMRQTSNLAVTAGIVASVMLAVGCLLGVVIAGGACVPGVERVVSAASWSLLLALACVPWRAVLPHMPFAGVFSGYEALVESSAAAWDDRGLAAGLLGQFLVLPLAAMLGSLLIVARFRGGVARGIVHEHMSEIDERLEEEISRIRQRGPGTNTGSRASGAFQRAMGAIELDNPPVVGAGAIGSRSDRSVRPVRAGRTVGAATGEESHRRPI